MVDETDGGRICHPVHDDIAVFMYIQYLSSHFSNVAYGSEPPHVGSYGPPAMEMWEIDLNNCVEAQQRAQDINAVNVDDIYDACALAAKWKANYEKMLDSWMDELFTCENAVDVVSIGTGIGAARVLAKKSGRKVFHKWRDRYPEKKQESDLVLNEQDAGKFAQDTQQFSTWAGALFGFIIGEEFNKAACDKLERLMELSALDNPF